jgi:hypothetical protein
MASSAQNPNRGPHQKGRIVGVIGLVAVLAASLAVLTTTSASAWLRQHADQMLHRVQTPTEHAFHPTPTPPRNIIPHPDRFYWEHAVPWGSLLVDGQPGPNLATLTAPAGATPPVPSFTLATGHHTIEYRVQLFPTLDCTVSVPSASGDTCPLASAADGATVSTIDGSRILDLSAIPGQLSAQDESALQSVAQTALDAPITAAQMSTGDHYLDGTGALKTMSASAQSWVEYRINTDASAATADKLASCVTICDLAGVIAAPADSFWHLTAHVIVSWRYQLAGQNSAFLDGAPASVNVDDAHLLVPLEVQWQGGKWSVQVPALAVQGDSLPCEVAQHQRDRTVASSPSLARWQNVAWGTVPAPQPANGCLLIGGKSTASKGPLTGAAPLLLYRCGVLLTANAEAKQAFPMLPVATTAEQSLAHSLAPGIT